MTHAEGFYRDLFKKFKPSFTRILMMGVSPVTMDDVTSGYNIATSLTLEKQWNEAEEQIRGYARGEVVRQMTQGTELHLVIAQIKGYDLLKLDKVES